MRGGRRLGEGRRLDLLGLDILREVQLITAVARQVGYVFKAMGLPHLEVRFSNRYDASAG